MLLLPLLPGGRRALTRWAAGELEKGRRRACAWCLDEEAAAIKALRDDDAAAAVTATVTAAVAMQVQVQGSNCSMLGLCEWGKGRPTRWLFSLPP